MQVPEKLALIGGSILLSSTLIFTLKSQASSIIPSVSHSISHVFNHIGDAQKSSDFDSNFKQAQKSNETTGNWGSSKWYINKDMNLHVGAGVLQGRMAHVIGKDKTKGLRTINFDQEVKAPQDSSFLLAGDDITSLNDNDGNHSITSINGLDKIDTSQVTNMDGIFSKNHEITNMDLSSWDTSHVTNLGDAFTNNNSLQSLNVQNWNVRNVKSLFWAFYNDRNLTDLNLSGWQTSNLENGNEIFDAMSSLQKLDIRNFDTTHANMSNLFGGLYSPLSNDIHQIRLGDKTYLKNDIGLSGDWKNGNQVLSNNDLLSSGFGSNPAHPGIWVKQ